jgi:3-deoxy-D-manno-octulosonate 8-phosphate phosphatase KdsC-like HAD superfamily phosphatase
VGQERKKRVTNRKMAKMALNPLTIARVGESSVFFDPLLKLGLPFAPTEA